VENATSNNQSILSGEERELKGKRERASKYLGDVTTLRPGVPEQAGEKRNIGEGGKRGLAGVKSFFRTTFLQKGAKLYNSKKGLKRVLSEYNRKAR